jgi:hypothetical protein
VQGIVHVLKTANGVGRKVVEGDKTSLLALKNLSIRTVCSALSDIASLFEGAWHWISFFTN